MKRDRPWVYIAGPISKGDTHANVHNGMAVFKYLWERGFQPICPHWSAIQQMAFPMSWDEWLEYDMPLVDASDAVFRIAGESVGADRETARAAEKSVPVYTDVNVLIQDFKEKGYEVG